MCFPIFRADFYREANNKEFFQDGMLKAIPRKLLQRPVGRLYRPRAIRLVEKTPANCFRIPLLRQLFPDARFLYLIRRPEDAISSLMEGWKVWSRTQGAWTFGNWHYLVPPGWLAYRARTLQEICAFQWIESNAAAWRDLNQYCKGQFMTLRHEDLVADPGIYGRILEFCGLPASRHFDSLMARTGERVFTTGGSRPRPDKWKELHRHEIESVRGLFRPLAESFY